MRKYNYWKYSVVLISLFLLMMLLVSCRKEGRPYMKNGILDLSNWDLFKDGAVTFDGEWEFYWNQLLSPNDFEAGRGEKTGMFKAPGIWKNYILPDKTKLPWDGYATFRLFVKLRKDEPDITLFINNMLNPYKMFMNGEEIITCGTVAKDRENTLPQGLPVYTNINEPLEHYEIIIQTAAYNFNGGPRGLLILYNQKDYQRQRFIKDIIDGFMIGVIFFMAIYHLVLFGIRRNDKASLYFSLFCFLLFIRILSQNNYLEIPIATNLFQQILLKIEYLTFYFAAPIFMLFLRVMYPGEFNKRFVLLFQIIAITCSLIVLVTPIQIFEKLTLRFYQGVTLINIAYCIFGVAVAVYRKRIGSVYCLIGFIIFTITVVYDFSLSYFQIVRQYIVSFGVAGFSLFQSLILALKFSKSFKKVERLSEELQDNNEKLVQLDKLKDEFLANTSHELRTPLNGIIGLASSLIDGIAGELSEQVTSNLYFIEASGKRLANLVNDILDFSKIKNNQLHLHFAVVDLYTVADLVLTISKPLTKDKEITMVNEIPVDIPYLYADANRLQQIMFNLIGNAIKFTDEGRITVSARQLPDNEAQNEPEPNREYIQISICDTGIGIPEEKFETIFKSFEQIDGSTSRKHGGTGLGLTITKKLIELHRGSINVKSQLGKGSTFIFTIPISHIKDKEAIKQVESKITVVDNIINITKQVAEQRGIAVSGKAKYTILIADDDPINLQVLENHLTLANYSIIKVANGEQAYHTVRDRGDKLDLVVLDVMMPKLTGIEACQKIRELYSINKLPVIIVTAKTQITDLVRGLDVGANDYITKPYIKEELLSRIKNLLELKNKTTELIKTRIVGIHALAELIELKDSYTGGHLKRVAEYSRLIANELKKMKHSKWKEYINSKYIEDLGESSILHDIGKVGIPDKILFKPGKLSDSEFDLMKSHTTIGGETLEKAIKELDVDYLKLGKEIALYHHERYDGTGYPEGLKGEEIPLSARIVALADVYDALTTSRPYRKALSHDKAYKIITVIMGASVFDPDILNIFIKNASKFKRIAKKYQETALRIH